MVSSLKNKNTKILKDPILDFLPRGETNFVILGTMASYVAREIDGTVNNNSFYYHDGRNRFWGVLSYLLTGKEISFRSISEKKDFLNKYGVALANLVSTIEVDSAVGTSSDRVLFKAFGDGKLEFKKASPEMISLIRQKPVFFTCYRKPKIDTLLDGYNEFNKIFDERIVNRITFLHSPTRRGHQHIAEKWRDIIRMSYPSLLGL